MTTWRLTYNYAANSTDNDGVKSYGEHTKPYPATPESEADGLGKLSNFLDARKKEYKDKLVSVALERSERDATYNDPYGDWKEVKSLRA